jgi:uncharacterized protein
LPGQGRVGAEQRCHPEDERSCTAPERRQWQKIPPIEPCQARRRHDPATAFALFVLSRLQMNSGGAHQVITAILAVALLLTAVVLIARDRISARYAQRLSHLDERSIATLTVAMGAVLGILVTFSSVGVGAIGVTALVLLYPGLPMARIVGSDIAHTVPLTLVAGLGHGAMGSIDLHTLLSLLVGSFPGIFVGSAMSARIPDLVLRYVLAGILIMVGARLALDVPVT